MRVCLILEGCYPYVRGGVSTWAQEYIKSNPELEFILWTVHADRKNAKKSFYTLPENVAEMREIFLEDAYRGKRSGRIEEEACKTILDAMSCVLHEQEHRWDELFEQCRENKINAFVLGNSESFLDFAVELAGSSDETIGLSEAFYGLRSMLIPLYFLLQQDIPEADLYHSAVTGYGGMLGAMAKYVTGKPFVLTEHGIYPREREEELLQSDWVIPSLRRTWIILFYNLSRCAYTYANKVTALFRDASLRQIEIGCPPEKCTIIANGIHYEKYQDIAPRESEGEINIGAFLRFAPIKDIKTLIYAFFELNRRISNVNLYLLGGTDDPSYKEECMALIERLNLKNVFVEGHVDTAAYIEKMDFTIMSSISEGQPLAILESLAAAKPCVTTNVGNCKALLEETEDEFGQSGFCCTPMDSVGLAEAMLKLCLDRTLRITFGNNGRKRIKNNYTHAIMQKKYLAVYREVCDPWQE